MVKGLAKLGNRLRHDLWVKCVDVSLFETKSGYSPMTRAGYQRLRFKSLSPRRRELSVTLGRMTAVWGPGTAD